MLAKWSLVVTVAVAAAVVTVTTVRGIHASGALPERRLVSGCGRGCGSEGRGRGRVGGRGC